MKKIMMTLAAGRMVLTFFFCCAMTTTVFTACGSDDDDNNTPKMSEIRGIGARYTFSVTEQMSQLCDYTITYYDIDGKLTTEKAAWTVKDGVATWEKSVSNTSSPATFGLKVSAKVKDGTQLNDAKVDNFYPLTEKMNVEGITTDAKTAWEKTVYFRSGSVHGNTTVEKLQSSLDAMERHGGMVNKYYTFDKDGNEIASGSME